jgi:serine protease Do
MDTMKRFTTGHQSRLLYGVIILSLVALLGCGAPSLAAVIDTVESPAEMAPAPAPAVEQAATDASVLAALEGTLGNVYAEVSPSVVNIQVVQKMEAVSQQIPEMPGFRFFEPPSEGETPQDRYRSGGGSGFVWDKDGHIVTNNHVVEGADKITVTFSDGYTVDAELVGRDPDSDLAVIKVDLPGNQLAPLQLASSADLKVGQMAIAIGNPFGLEGTMTVGFISALGRLLPVESQAVGGSFSIPDMIQTDAPINPGNSGGVLVDDEGEVIGVTTAIISPVRASAGIGFAVPSAIVGKVVPVLITDGSYTHPWLGISGTSLNPDLAEAAGLDKDQRGALVVDVTPDGPADAAGLRGSDREIEVDGQKLRTGGDVIIAANDESVKTFDDIVTFLARETEVGDTITVTVLRDGETVDVEVKLDPRPEQVSEETASARGEDKGAWLGINGTTMAPEIAEAMDLDADQAGVLVGQVEAGSPADEAGLRGSYKPTTINGERVLVGGDVITALNGEDVTDMAELQRLIQQAGPDSTVTLTVLRDGKPQELEVTLGERQ